MGRPSPHQRVSFGLHLPAATALAKSHQVKVALFSRKQVRQFFFAESEGTKHALAQILAQRYPEELGSRLPPKRRYWMNEDSRMDIFEAVALGLALWLQKSESKRSIGVTLSKIETTWLLQL